MQYKHLVLALAATAAVACSVAGPMAHHPNLIAAREDAEHAIQKLRNAQKANEYDLGGHAKHAEELLGQAIDEMRAAAEADRK